MIILELKSTITENKNPMVDITAGQRQQNRGSVNE